MLFKLCLRFSGIFLGKNELFSVVRVNHPLCENDLIIMMCLGKYIKPLIYFQLLGTEEVLNSPQNIPTMMKDYLITFRKLQT